MVKDRENPKKNSINSPIFLKEHFKMMSLEPNELLDFILNHSNPKELVSSFSEEIFYFFLCTIGINKSSALISLASDTQWEYFLDIEIWDKSSLNYFSMTNLFVLMMKANPDRFSKWCFYNKFQLIEAYFFRNIDIKILHNDEDPSDLGENFFTNDGLFYFNFIESHSSSPYDEYQFIERRNIMLYDMLLRFSNMDHFRYQSLLMEVIGVIPAELEEELFRLRNIRLAEKGFLPFHEAIGVYQPITPEEIKKKSKKILRKNTISYSIYPSIHFYNDILGDNNLFIKALKIIRDDLVLHQLKVEFISLCNLIIVADSLKIKNRYDLKKIVRKASGFLNIGIEVMLENGLKQDIVIASDIIKNWTLDNIFRVGYGRILNLRRRFLNWYHDSWFNNHNLKLYFWGKRYFGFFGGLLLDKPMFFIDSSVGSMYREFKKSSEIYQVEEILDQVKALDNIFFCFNLASHTSNSKYDINVNNLLLTSWLKSSIGFNIQDELNYSIPLEIFKLFYSTLWEEDHGLRRIKNSKKNDFLIWVADKMDIELVNMPKNLSLFFRGLFQKIEDELSEVKTEDLDPRYIDLFIIDT